MVRVTTLRSRKGCNITRDMVMISFGALLSMSCIPFFLAIGAQFSTSCPPSSGGSTLPSLISYPKPGWNPIHVFYGKMNHLFDPVPEDRWIKDSPRHPKGGLWFSQHGQDVTIAKVFKLKSSGYFVDLAANDAVWASNTFALEQNFGWKGICIEANPFYWYRLSFRNCHAVGSIVGGHDFDQVNVTLGASKGTGPFGGIVGNRFDNKNAKAPELRYTANLKTILEMFGAPKVIDYLSLDVEGAEDFVMDNFAWNEYTFLSMTVERPSASLQSIFKQHGYKKAMDIKAGDTLWVHESLYETALTNLAENPEEISGHAVTHF